MEKLKGITPCMLVCLLGKKVYRLHVDNKDTLGTIYRQHSHLLLGFDSPAGNESSLGFLSHCNIILILI